MQTVAQRLANPTRFMELSARILPWVAGAAAVVIAYGLYLSFFDSPPDYQQGETVRIMYIHVPAAWLGDGGLRVHRRLGVRPPRFPPSAGRRLGQGRGAAGRSLHVSGARHRIAVGAPDVGHLLGVGCAADLGADPVLSLSRPHRAPLLDRGRDAGGQAHGDSRAGRHRDAADHQVLGRVRQHAASGRERVAAGRPVARSRRCCCR